VLFHDDAVLSEYEDDSEFARAVYKNQFKLADNISEINHSSKDASTLMTIKSQWITDFTLELASELKRYQPDLKTARNLYAPAMLNPDSERWLGQNYENFLTHYDYTAVMAMPSMENAKNSDAWLKSLVSKAQSTNNGINKTVFELQARDWKLKRNIDAKVLGHQLQVLTNAGAKHVGYYPDDFVQNSPDMESIRPYISSRNFPYLPRTKKN
jgi:biofilm PGA synthesis lipoprotein PgaB